MVPKAFHISSQLILTHIDPMRKGITMFILQRRDDRNLNNLPKVTHPVRDRTRIYCPESDSSLGKKRDADSRGQEPHKRSRNGRSVSTGPETRLCCLTLRPHGFSWEHCASLRTEAPEPLGDQRSFSGYPLASSPPASLLRRTASASTGLTFRLSNFSSTGLHANASFQLRLPGLNGKLIPCFL